jgi:hypothetical protein
VIAYLSRDTSLFLLRGMSLCHIHVIFVFFWPYFFGSLLVGLHETPVQVAIGATLESLSNSESATGLHGYSGIGWGIISWLYEEHMDALGWKIRLGRVPAKVDRTAHLLSMYHIV